MKKVGVSMDSWVVDEIVDKRPQGINRSEWVQQLLIKGYKNYKDGVTGILSRENFLTPLTIVNT